MQIDTTGCVKLLFYLGKQVMKAAPARLYLANLNLMFGTCFNADKWTSQQYFDTTTELLFNVSVLEWELIFPCPNTDFSPV